MRISVTHSTVYRYDRPVWLEPHVFRMRPRVDAAQMLLRHTLAIEPAPAGMTEFLDQDGNVATLAWFTGASPELAVHSACEVETLRENPFDYILPSSHLFTVPLAYDEPLASALAPYCAAGDSAEVREFARSVADGAGWRTLDFLNELTRALYERSTHVVRDEGAPLAPEETLRSRTGSCRDLAVLLCAACRSLKVPARFVSGYEIGAGAADRAHLHAWAEVYLDGGGWRGYDPSRGLAVSTGHLAVAAAADSRLAAPITGTFRGTASAQMQFQLSVRAC